MFGFFFFPFGTVYPDPPVQVLLSFLSSVEFLRAEPPPHSMPRRLCVVRVEALSPSTVGLVTPPLSYLLAIASSLPLSNSKQVCLGLLFPTKFAFIFPIVFKSRLRCCLRDPAFLWRTNRHALTRDFQLLSATAHFRISALFFVSFLLGLALPPSPPTERCGPESTRKEEILQFLFSGPIDAQLTTVLTPTHNLHSE